MKLEAVRKLLLPALLAVAWLGLVAASPLSAQEPKLRATLKGHGPVAFSPDGKTLASAGADKAILLWDVATGKVRATLQPVRVPGDPLVPWVHSVVFSPDGNTLASGGGDRTVKLWDVASGKVRATFHGHKDDVYSVAFSPDGKTLASG